MLKTISAGLSGSAGLFFKTFTINLLQNGNKINFCLFRRLKLVLIAVSTDFAR
jgi:hypothetical protein